MSIQYPSPSAIARVLPDFHSFTVESVDPSYVVYKAFKNDPSIVNQSVQNIVSYDLTSRAASLTVNTSIEQTNKQTNNQTNNSTVLIKLIGRYDSVKSRWRAPTRSQARALLSHFDTLKALDARHVPHCVKPIAIKSVTVEDASDVQLDLLTNQSIKQSINRSLSPKSSAHIADHPLDLPSITRSRSLGDSRVSKFRSWCLIIEAPCGATLAELSNESRYQAGFPVSEVLPIALQLCAVLTAVHKDSLPRRGINTKCVCYDPLTCRIQLLDYGLPAMEAFELTDSPGRRVRNTEQASDDESEDDEEDDDLTSKGSPTSPTSTSTAQMPLPHSALNQLYVHDRRNFLCQCFMSPEQTGRIYRGVDSRSDIYSLGLMMWVLLTGKLPFVWPSTCDPFELVHSIITSPIPSVRTYAPHVPASLADIVAKCMDKQPNERYQSAPGLEADLFRVYQQLVEFASESGRFLPIPPALSSILPSRWNRGYTGSSDDDDDLSPHISTGKLSTRALISSPSASIGGFSPSIALRSFVKQLDDSLSDGSLSPHFRQFESPNLTSGRFERLPLRLPTAMPTDHELGLTEETSCHTSFAQFPLGREDTPSRLFLSQQLYGREKQADLMYEAISSCIIHGGRCLVVVHGLSGSGKSALIRSVVSDVCSKYRNVLVLSSKIDQYNRNLSMWKPIVNEAIINIFQQPGAIVAEWKARILEAVGSNGAIATEMFPVLNRLIGPQPRVPDLPPAQAQQRAITTLTSFLIKFCLGAKRPMIFSFDDVQWAHENCLALLENFAKQPIVSHVCFIVAYRSEEVQETVHPAARTISHLRTSLIPVTDIDCAPLTLSDFQQFVSDTLHTSNDKALPIAVHLLSRSNGNPFFARQILINLQKENQLVYHVYSPLPETNKPLRYNVDDVVGEWQLASAASLAKTIYAQSTMQDSKSIAQSENDIIQLVQSAVTRLQPEVSQLMSLAAYLGSSFCLGDLALVSQQSLSVVSDAMMQAAAEELVELSYEDTDNLLTETETVSATEWSSIPSSASLRKGEMSTYMFVHDRVQQACYNLIEPQDRPKTHLHFATVMLAEARKSSEFMKSHMLLIAGHVIKSLSLLTPQSAEAHSWSVFLLDAANKGYTMNNYISSLECANAAAILIGFDDPLVEDGQYNRILELHPASFEVREQLWRDKHDYVLDLSFFRARVLFLNRRHDESIAENQDALNHLSDPLDRHSFHTALQETYTILSRPVDAFRVNRMALGELGFDIPLRKKELTEEQLREAQFYEMKMENLAHLSYNEQLVNMLLDEFERKLAGRDILTLIDVLPPCTDPRQRAIARISSSIVAPLYSFAWEFTLPFCLLVMMQMLDHGIAGPHAHTVAMLGLQLLPFPEAVRSRRPLALSDLSIRIMSRYPHAWSEPKTKLTHAMCQVFYRPFSQCSPCFVEARRSAVENGVQLFVAYTLMTESFLDLWTLSFADFKAELAQFRALNVQTANDLVADLRLQAQEMSLSILEDPAFDVDDTDATLNDADIKFIERTKSVSYVCTIAFRVSRACVFYIMNQARGASEVLDSARLQRSPGDPAMAAMIILRVLSNAMLIRRLASSETFQASAESKIASSWAVIDADMLSLEACSESCPFTFGASCALARAEIGFAELVSRGNARFARPHSEENTDPDAPDERCVIESQYRAAVLGFSLSHAEADFGRSSNSDRMYFLRDAEQPQIECTWFVAAAHERFSEFLLFCDQPAAAMGLLMSSYNNWLTYGCQNKLRQLTRAYASRFGHFLTQIGAPEAIGAHPLTAPVLTVNPSLSTTDMPNAASLESLDFARAAFLSGDDDGDVIPSSAAHAAQFEASRDDKHESAETCHICIQLATQRWWETMMDSPEGTGTSPPDEVESFSNPLDRSRQPEQSDAGCLGLASFLSSSEDASEFSDSKLMFADFDLKTVMSATQAISKEIVLSKLLSILMTSCVRITGAERAILFSLNVAPKPHSSASSPRSSSPLSPPSSSSPSSSNPLVDSWTVDALLNVLSSRRVYVRPALISMSQSASSNALQDSSPGPRYDERSFDDDYPHSIMNFVIHAQHPVILSDASIDPMFNRDPYIQKNRVKSLLCLPLIHRGGVSSCLYLDNSTSAGLFRRERLLICKLIAAQASISIDNARLYDRVTRYTRMLEMRVAERTTELEQASREAQEASKAKSMFLSTMSHEIRTPMNGVIGGCDLLASDSSNLTPEQLEVLGIIRTSADAMLTIINDILDLSKIEAGRAQIINTSFQVRDCVESTLDVVSSKAHSKGLEIQYFCDLNVPMTIHSDYKRLTQCLFNLLSNAIKFTQQGEVALTVSVESDPAATDAQPTDSTESSFVLRFCVRDTGCGVPAEYQHLLWQPFSQVHTEMRRSGPAASGSGLGLIITKHLVEMMGGQVGFESQYGEGSKFWFTIRCTGNDENRPCSLQDSADIVKLLTKSKNVRCRPKCLLIHPFEVTRSWFSQVVSKWGVDVIPLRNVKEVRSLLENDQPVEYAAVVVDYRSISVSQLFDVETNQPVVISKSNPPSPHTRDETPRLHDSFTVPDVYMRFTLDHHLLEELGASIVKHAKHCNRAKPISVVGLGPINLMSTLRARIEREVPGGQVMHISTPIKCGILYKVMRTVVQSWLETKMGTTVAATLPGRRALSLSSRQSSADDKSVDEPNYTDIECIMIVEDNPVNRKVLQRMLDRAGFKPKQIIIAENGAIGVDKLHAWLKTHDQPAESADSTASKPASSSLSITSPAHISRSSTDTVTIKPASQSSSRKSHTRVCMLLDLLMPVLGGIEACHRIRASPDIPPDKQPYIIALTANAGPNDREMCLEAQMDDYLAKPVTLAELTKALKNSARGRKQSLGRVEEKDSIK